jgi:diguanylate cyclase (GGDEF)-like protein
MERGTHHFLNNSGLDHASNTSRAGTSNVRVTTTHFKVINDRCGHAVGDSVLHEFGEQLRQTVEPGQFAARMGGEEFCVVLPGDRQATAAALAERIRERCRKSIADTETGGSVNFTISVACMRPRLAKHSTQR